MSYTCNDCIFYINPCLYNKYKYTCAKNNNCVEKTTKACQFSIIKNSSKICKKNKIIKKVNVNKNKCDTYKKEVLSVVKPLMKIYNFKYEFTDDKIIINTIFDKWCILINDKQKRLELFHKNTKCDLNKYHKQNKIYKLNNIKQLFEYIKKHIDISFKRIKMGKLKTISKIKMFY